MALEINSQNFETLIADSKPVVVDFGATWCGPCQMVAPIIEELAHEYDGRVVIGKCDVDQDSDLPGRFNVRNIPTILFIKNGEVVSKLVGAQSKDVLKKAIEGLL
ncbi:thioredoxin [uncultured Porphyromonas sp.]|jgi:thioredoxin|uniref:thioredoxin n=1 Tax=uncultured Porphyromonas sp. TaxID=159274 RepID=UPI002632F87C|nr:thioredoxin [uncultured Porphyromonas sp.]